MRREGRVRGMPTSKSRLTGRCKAGNTRCSNCRDHPVEKSHSKRQGREKRFGFDVSVNPALAEWRLRPALLNRPSLFNSVGELDDVHSVHASIFVATVNSVIEAAFARTYGDNYGEIASTPSIDDAREAFNRELEVFESAFEEGTEFSHYGLSFLSSDNESWSDVELSEESDDDDWDLVDL